MILWLPWIPLLAAAVILTIPKEQQRLLRSIAITACALPFLLTLYHLWQFDLSRTGYQFVQRYPWLPAFGIQYQAGFDGINLTFCLLHALVSLAGVFVAARTQERPKEFLFYYLILTGSIYGVFTCLDLFFLYLYYEMTLIPLFPMIGIWGSQNKEYGAMKLTLFITTGAMLALFGLLLLYDKLGLNSFDLILIQDTLRTEPLGQTFQQLLAPFILVGFGVMASLWPLHSWSPIGYAAAPTAVSMLHAGVLKKMGPYFIIRVAVSFLPAGTAYWALSLAILAAIGIVYAGFAAIRQKDMKFMVGFSSVSHMGYVLLGIATLNLTGLSGAVLLIFSHGVMAACTFACIGFLYEQTHVRSLTDYGGLSKQVPFVAICFIMASMASLGLPGFSNFIAELMVFIGAWPVYPGLVILAVLGILITAIYLLRAIQKVCYGPVNPRWNQLRDAQSFAERFPFVLLLGALLLFGFWPNGLLRMIQPALGVLLS